MVIEMVAGAVLAGLVALEWRRQRAKVVPLDTTRPTRDSRFWQPRHGHGHAPENVSCWPRRAKIRRVPGAFGSQAIHALRRIHEQRVQDAN